MPDIFIGTDLVEVSSDEEPATADAVMSPAHVSSEEEGARPKAEAVPDPKSVPNGQQQLPEPAVHLCTSQNSAQCRRTVSRPRIACAPCLALAEQERETARRPSTTTTTGAIDAATGAPKAAEGSGDGPKRWAESWRAARKKR